MLSFCFVQVHLRHLGVSNGVNRKGELGQLCLGKPEGDVRYGDRNFDFAVPFSSGNSSVVSAEDKFLWISSCIPEEEQA